MKKQQIHFISFELYLFLKQLPINCICWYKFYSASVREREKSALFFRLFGFSSAAQPFLNNAINVYELNSFIDALNTESHWISPKGRKHHREYRNVVVPVPALIEPICLSCSNSTMSAKCKRIGTKFNDCIECHVLRKQFTSHKWWKWSRFSYLRALSAREHVCELHCVHYIVDKQIAFIECDPFLRCCANLSIDIVSVISMKKRKKKTCSCLNLSLVGFFYVSWNTSDFFSTERVCVCVLFDSIFFLATTLLAVISYAKSTICVSCMVCIDLPPRFSITISK